MIIVNTMYNFDQDFEMLMIVKLNIQNISRQNLSSNMIHQLTQKIAHFRSQLLMSRYEKSQQTAKQILNDLEILKSIGLHKQQLQQLQEYVQRQLALSKMLAQVIGEPLNSTKSHNANKLNLSPIKSQTDKFAQQKQSPNQNNEQYIKNNATLPNKQIGNVGKWGSKNKRIKSQSYNQNSNLSNSLAQSTKLQQFSQTFNKNQPIQVITEELELSRKMDTHQAQILERELILPLSMPEFFKNKEPRRLIICFYEKCGEVLNKISSQLIIKQVIEIDSLTDAISNQQTQITQGFKLFVCPLLQHEHKEINKILANDKNILVLYSQKNRVIMAEKPSSLQDSHYQLIY